jgi:hypothetical protein
MVEGRRWAKQERKCLRGPEQMSGPQGGALATPPYLISLRRAAVLSLAAATVAAVCTVAATPARAQPAPPNFRQTIAIPLTGGSGGAYWGAAFGETSGAYRAIGSASLSFVLFAACGDSYACGAPHTDLTLTFTTPTADVLTITGHSSEESFTTSGTWTVTGGSGRFAVAVGSGTFAASYAPAAYPSFGTETVSLSGTLFHR